MEMDPGTAIAKCDTLANFAMRLILPLLHGSHEKRRPEIPGAFGFQPVIIVV
jgi:hypothetical protein